MELGSPQTVLWAHKAKGEIACVSVCVCVSLCPCAACARVSLVCVSPVLGPVASLPFLGGGPKLPEACATKASAGPGGWAESPPAPHAPRPSAWNGGAGAAEAEGLVPPRRGPDGSVGPDGSRWGPSERGDVVLRRNATHRVSLSFFCIILRMTRELFDEPPVDS